MAKHPSNIDVNSAIAQAIARARVEAQRKRDKALNNYLSTKSYAQKKLLVDAFLRSNGRVK